MKATSANRSRALTPNIASMSLNGCADGLPSKSVAAELGIHEHTVGKWRRRFLKDRCDGLLDEARPGRPRTIAGSTHFSEIRRGVPLMSQTLLSQRLKELERAGIVERRGDDPRRREWH